MNPRMSAPHQVITGALNRGENVYATGSVEGATFIVCAVGSDVVILDADFSRVQVIPGCSRGAKQLVNSVSCCQDSGKIAATYGNTIKVFEPMNTTCEKKRAILSYQWMETQCFTVKERVNFVLWNMDGLRMTVVIGDELFLYQHRSLSCVVRPGSAAPVMFCISEEENFHDAYMWDIVWSVQLGQQPKYIKYSPDGVFLAISGENDHLVKIFYQDSFDSQEHLSFGSFVLNHPAPVRGFEWRRIGRYMPRKCIQTVLMTWCEDNTSRIWKESPFQEITISDLCGDGGEVSWEKNRPRKFFGKHFRVKKIRNRIVNKLKGIVSERKRCSEESLNALGLRAQIGKSPSFSDLQSTHYSLTNVQFHLTATINAETDCMLVPSMENGGVLQKPLCVHWLNNKELGFSIGAEKLLAEVVQLEGYSGRKSATVSTSEHADSEDGGVASSEHSDRGEWVNSALGSPHSETTSSKDVLDVKLEVLLRQWSRSSDVLFAVHPVDGSLLIWTVEWLDDLHRQPVVSFTSRIPSALPITDASSLHPTLDTFNPFEPMYVDTFRKEEGKDADFPLNKRMLERKVSATIHLLTNHENGSLNLWHMALDDSSNFTSILYITHMSRMCGHRFQINQVVPHPVLPLLLTTSQFRSEELAGCSEESFLSELILWKISPVGPLCKSGGVKELARVGSSLRTGFDCAAWIPAILPSCTLATICNSPTCCFIASDGENFVIYQIVTDARDFLAEIYNSTRRNKADVDKSSLTALSGRRTNIGLFQHFDIVSTQSTAKPGCVLKVGQIIGALKANSRLLMLNVFPERLLTNGSDPMLAERSSHLEERLMDDRHFVVAIECEDDCEYFVMFLLVISSQSSQLELAEEEQLQSVGHSAPLLEKLVFTSKEVCRQRVPLPKDVHVVSAAPTAGHLPSSSVYPACQAPHLVLTSCDDDKVRFWRCVVSEQGSEQKYEWAEWNMINDNQSSELELEGTIFSVSAAHGGRIACAYDPRGECLEAQNISDVEIGVFECESSGGAEWFREDTFAVKHVQTSNFFSYQGVAADRAPSSLSEPSQINSSFEASIRDVVRLDWVSTEDGSHILTAGVGAKIYMYTQVSLDPAQRNVTLMKESESTLRRPSLQKASSLVAYPHTHNRLARWVRARVLELHSADGLPPLPTTLGWARDGLLIVGMPSEMRVYNQWNMQRRSDDQNIKHQEPNAQFVSLVVSQSHLMLDQLHGKKELPSNKSRLFVDLINRTLSPKESGSSSVLDAISAEGLFETARLASPILPQYHPKQLTVLLNAGRTKRVKAILRHVLIALKQRQMSTQNPLSRAASMRRMSTVNAIEERSEGSEEQKLSINFEEDCPDYYEIDDIAPLPLHSLIAADMEHQVDFNESGGSRTGSENPAYDNLFSSNKLEDKDLNELLAEDEPTATSLQHSVSKERKHTTSVPTVFSAQHNRMLTELLTHTHLPGLSSVDQMHLLAIADTLSHFSTDAVEKLSHATAGGYATASFGETVDECGLRFLMAMKQYEYLLLCLPINQRMELKKNGLSSSDIIWAQHSETETELLNAVSSLQKSNPTWEELRSLGIAWWLKNTASLKICLEKLAKAAFQQNQDPMDASLYYMAMRKRNVLTHLFKTVRNQKMAEFFTQDFTKDHWKKVAAKNAFVLMSKQRFHHAAAFFLLSGSIRDAVQTILRKCRDLQLAIVVLRLYETDVDVQQAMLKEMLCREVLGQSPEDFEEFRGVIDNDSSCWSPEASKDPFLRSMTYWFLKDYTRSAHTLVQEAHRDGATLRTPLSDIFNFYSFLRRHPLVVRQRIADAGVKVSSTEQFLAIGKALERQVTSSERRLYFRTAAEHMAHGCPMLALDVLSRLPKNICSGDGGLLDASFSGNEVSFQDVTGCSDVIAQHLKFVASMRIFTEELSTLASGCEVDGGRFRKQLFHWIEKEVGVLKTLCDYRSSSSGAPETEPSSEKQGPHVSASSDSSKVMERENAAAEKWKWLTCNQNLLRSFTSFCALHSAQNHRLTSALMELLLLLLESQKDMNVKPPTGFEYNSFPLFIASISTSRMFVSSPLSFIENQCYDLLTSITDLATVPDLGNHLQKAYKLYNLSQGLSSSLYQSLCGIDESVTAWAGTGTIQRPKSRTYQEDLRVLTLPAHWPGVESLVALLSQNKDAQAPQLRKLLAESFVAVSMSLFCFALAVYDSRWLYRMSAHQMDALQFALIFGGGGERKPSTPPMRPPRPQIPSAQVPGVSHSSDDGSSRSKYYSKLAGPEGSFHDTVTTQSPSIAEQCKTKWVPPKKNIVQFFATKPPLDSGDEYSVDFDSDGESGASDARMSDHESLSRNENISPKSFAWQLLRLALVEQQIYRIRQFLMVAGFDSSDIPAVVPRVEAVFRLLDGWTIQLRQNLCSYRDGCPIDLLPEMTVNNADLKAMYEILTKEKNTPFESDDPQTGPLRRLWTYLAHQPHLQPVFARHIFSQKPQQEAPKNSTATGIENQPLPDAYKIVQKDHDPIVAFACSQERPGWLAVSTGRELQEMDISGVFEDPKSGSSYLFNRLDLVVNSTNRRDPLKENDDYQFYTENATQVIQAPRAATMIFKRTVSGIRRIDAHPTAPFYVTGSSDGSVRVWEWGVGQPVYTARVAGQHAKVTKVSFSCNGNKFAAVDADGMLSLWQATHSTEHKKPFFSQRCHNKSAADVRFFAHSSSVLVTAGASSGEFNLGLWDTLLPQTRALVHTWVAHPEGATVAMYMPNQQTIVSGGRHGELCLWDVRQRQLRVTVKAFEWHQTVKTLISDCNQDLIVAGSSDGDIKIWSADLNPQLMYSLPGEHAAKTGFSFRQVAQSAVQGVQQVYVDQQLRLFSCGADASLKFRTLPSIYNMSELV